MMRKASVLVLLTLYSAVAIGVPLHYHYCSGELKHITLFGPKECASHDDADHEVSIKAEEPLTCCQGNAVTHCSEPVSTPDCCDDETEILQLDDGITALLLLQGNYADAIYAYEFAELPSVQQKEDSPGDPMHFLQSKSVSTWIEHCSFIFYG